MSDLYQQAPGSKGYGPQDWEVVRRMAPGAMLLWVTPVEPDQRKIEGRIARLVGYAETGHAVTDDDIMKAATDILGLLGDGEETP